MRAFVAPRETISLALVDPDVVARLSSELRVSEMLATILAARGLRTYQECERFFRPSVSHFLDPFLFEDAERAARRIGAAIDNREYITVYGDYDVDGVTATALLVRFLTRIGARCDYYLPNRLTEGYGVSRAGVEAIAARGASLIITVDCGITAVSEVEHARKRGIDVIVTDHHTPHDALPAAAAVLDPCCGDYPDKNLAGVGVALKLCQAVCAMRKLDPGLWEEYLDIAALGTAADIVPMTGENRVITRLGFTAMERTANVGLRCLIERQGLAGKTLMTREVVFLLAPCINAAGRLGEPTRGVKLLLADDEAEAMRIAGELVEQNRERQALDQRVQQEAVDWVCANCDSAEDRALVAAHSSWHIGVVGIVASKLVERFYRPSFLFSVSEDGVAKGSGRSVAGLHLLDALHDCKEHLISYGGHAAAAGAKLHIDNLGAFRRAFNAAVSARLPAGDRGPAVIADAEARLPVLTHKFFDIINRMAPFGPGNMRPVFLSRHLRHRFAPRLVGKNHVKMAVAAEGSMMDAIAFNFGERLDEIKKMQGFSLAYTLDKNEWNGRVTLQMKVKGVSL